jgi:hypothetical protein
MTVGTNRQKLEEEGIHIQGILAGQLRARNFECLVKYLEDEDFKNTLKIIIDERNERASTNVRVVREHTSVVAKLGKELLTLENSKIYQAGKWLLDALSLKGNALVKALLERDLLPKGYYNEAITEISQTTRELREEYREANITSKKIIKQLQLKNDDLRKKLVSLEEYIINNYGKKAWNQILGYMSNNNTEYYKKNKELQVENDPLWQEVFLQEYIIDKYGEKTWSQILSYLSNNDEDENRGNKNV